MVEKTNEEHEDVLSNCCGATMINDICSDCKEHCVSVKEEESLDKE